MQGSDVADGVHADTPGELTQAEADALLANAILTDEGRQDPYRVYDLLRAARPRHASAAGTTVVTGYGDGLELLRSPKWGRPEPDMDVPSTFGDRPDRSDRSSTVMLFANPPKHTQLRAPFARTFTPRRVEELRQNVRTLLAPILDRVAEEGDIEVMGDVATTLPVAVISELIGVPSDEVDFRHLVRDATANIDPSSDEAALARADEALIEMGTYFIELMAEKRRKPDDRLLSALLALEATGEGLTEEELLANILLLYAAGFETTSNLIGNGLRAFLLYPDELQAVRNDPSLIPAAVLEILRWDSPVQINGRTALADTDLFGEPAPRGTTVMVLQGAGNTDPSAYADPRAFSVRRFTDAAVPQPLSFGWGAHHCLGAHLARAEGEEVFAALFDRFRSIELTDVWPRYRASTTLRGLEEFHVTFA